jgi:hypothetical protein
MKINKNRREQSANLRNLVRVRCIHNYTWYTIQATSTHSYLGDPAPGLVCELARVVRDQLVPEALVRTDEPLAVAVVNACAALTMAPVPLPLPLVASRRLRRAIIVQEELLLELAVESVVVYTDDGRGSVYQGHCR